jgi:hypothetical protein
MKKQILYILAFLVTANCSLVTAWAQAPNTPSGLSCVRLTKTEISCSWTDNSGDETGFKIERSTDGTNWTNLQTTAANATSFSYTGLVKATTYQFRVRAANGSGDSANTSVALATTTEVCQWGAVLCDGSPGSGGGGFTTIYYPSGQLVSNRCQAYDTPAINPPLRTRYVSATASGSGNGLTSTTPWTIAQANTNAQPGDLFLIRGTFTNAAVNPAQNGTSVNKIIYREEPGQIWRFTPPGLFESYLRNNMQHVIIDGAEFFGESYPTYLGEASHVWFLNIWQRGGGGMILYRSSNIRVENSILEDIGNFATNEGDAIVMLDDSDNNVVVRNTIGDAGHGGIDLTLQNDDQGTMEGNIFAHNRIRNGRSSGFFDGGKSRGTLFECNEIRDGATETPRYTPNGVNAFYAAGKNGIFRYNLIAGNNGAAVSFQAYVFGGSPQYAENNQFYHNTVVGNTDLGLQLGATVDGWNRGNILENNIFYNNTDFNFEGSTYPIVADFYNHNSGAALWTSTFTDGTIVRYTGFQGGGRKPMILVRNPAQGGNITFDTLNALQTGYSAWTNNLQTTTPNFANAPGGDYTLSANSPFVGAGRSIPGVNCNQNCDLGAFER